eukprot:sb/3471208/
MPFQANIFSNIKLSNHISLLPSKDYSITIWGCTGDTDNPNPTLKNVPDEKEIEWMLFMNDKKLVVIANNITTIEWSISDDDMNARNINGGTCADIKSESWERVWLMREQGSSWTTKSGQGKRDFYMSTSYSKVLPGATTEVKSFFIIPPGYTPGEKPSDAKIAVGRQFVTIDNKTDDTLTDSSVTPFV